MSFPCSSSFNLKGNTVGLIALVAARGFGAVTIKLMPGAVDDGIGAGAIIGIIIGVAAVVGAIGGGYYYYKKKNA